MRYELKEFISISDPIMSGDERNEDSGNDKVSFIVIKSDESDYLGMTYYPNSGCVFCANCFYSTTENFDNIITRIDQNN